MKLEFDFILEKIKPPKRTPVRKNPKAIIKIAFLVNVNFPIIICFIFFLVFSAIKGNGFVYDFVACFSN